MSKFEDDFRAALEKKHWPKLPLLDFSIKSYLGDPNPTAVQLRDKGLEIADKLASEANAGNASVLLIKNNTALNCRVSNTNELIAGHDRRPVS